MPTIDFALSIGPNCRAKHHLRRRLGSYAINGVLDWQVTPAAACLAYIDADFTGMFDRDDLDIRDGVVWNSRWGTSHQHEFPANLSNAGLDEHYPRARSRHDHLCDNFRSTMQTGNRVLLAFSGIINDDAKQRLVDAYSAYGRKAELFFIFEPHDDPSYKPSAADWQGDGALWDRLLDPYRLGVWPSLNVAGQRVAKVAWHAFPGIAHRSR